MEHQDIFKKHSDFIWEIVNLLRGSYHPPQYRRVMIALTVLRRLECVLEASKDKVLAEHRLLKTTDTGQLDVRDGQAPKATGAPEPDKEVA